MHLQTDPATQSRDNLGVPYDVDPYRMQGVHADPPSLTPEYHNVRLLDSKRIQSIEIDLIDVPHNRTF